MILSIFRCVIDIDCRLFATLVFDTDNDFTSARLLLQLAGCKRYAFLYFIPCMCATFIHACEIDNLHLRMLLLFSDQAVRVQILNLCGVTKNTCTVDDDDVHVHEKRPAYR